MPARPDAASAFRALHEDFLILANAWDAGSARLIAAAGAQAIATSSAAVAWSHGYADGHDLPFEKLARVTEEIARVVSAPITVDMEGGYSDDPAEVATNARALIDAGASGINLEDGRQPHELHLRKIEAVRAAAENAGVALFINARTDVYLARLVAAEQAVEETIRRGRACLEAGASGVFAPLAHAPEDIRAIAQALAAPLNIMALPGLPDAAGLKALGVRRLSAATSLYRIAASGALAAARAFLDAGDSDALAACAVPGLPDLNTLFRRQGA